MSARFAIPVVFLAGVSLITLSHGGRAEGPKGPAADRVKVVRATYEKLPPTILGVKEPIKVTQCQDQKMVHGLMFTDANGTNHYFMWWLDKEETAGQKYDSIVWVRYKGRLTLREKKFRLPIRGPEEDALYGLLLRWAAKEKKKKIDPFDKETLKDVNSLLKKLDDRFAGEKPVLQK